LSGRDQAMGVMSISPLPKHPGHRTTEGSFEFAAVVVILPVPLHIAHTACTTG